MVEQINNDTFIHQKGRAKVTVLWTKKIIRKRIGIKQEPSAYEAKREMYLTGRFF